jgi:hypothetical protein
MTDYEPWAGMNFQKAVAAESLERDRNELSYLVFRNDVCIAAFRDLKDAEAFKGRRRLKIKEVPWHVPIPK